MFAELPRKMSATWSFDSCETGELALTTTTTSAWAAVTARIIAPATARRLKVFISCAPSEYEVDSRADHVHRLGNRRRKAQGRSQCVGTREADARRPVGVHTLHLELERGEVSRIPAQA